LSDHELQLQEYRAEVPLAGDDEVERALRRTLAGGRLEAPSPRWSFRRPRVAIAISAAALVLGTGAIAAVAEGPWWQSGAPPVDPQAVVSVARDNMPASVRVADARTVATDGDAALVAVPLDTSGYCLIPALDGRAVFGSSCIYEVRDPASGDADTMETASRPAVDGDAARWIAYGRITDPRAASIDLGAYTVHLVTGGFFLTEIPSDLAQKLGGTANRGSILDSSGHVLRSGCVNWGDPPGTPAGSAHADTTLWIDQPAGACKPQLLPPEPTLELSQAKQLFDVTLTQPYSIWQPGQQIAFEQVPASDGRTCVIATGPGLTPSGENHCGVQAGGPWPSGLPINTETGTQLAHLDGKPVYVFDVSGTVDPRANIARLTLTAGSATAQVSYADGFFFAQLPATTPGPLSGAIPLPAGPWILTGYDSADHEVTHIDLNAQQQAREPH